MFAMEYLRSKLIGVGKSKTSTVSYSPVYKDEDDSSSETTIEPPPARRTKFRFCCSVFPWFLSAFLLCTNLITLALISDSMVHGEASHSTHSRPGHGMHMGGGSSRGSFETGWATDFADARASIEVVETRFTGAPAFYDNGTMYIPHPDPVRYTGDPRKYPEVDVNWEKLLAGRYFRVTAEEAKATFGKDWHDYFDPKYGAYLTGIDMFHTLHCINHIRREYYPDYYEDGKYEDQHEVEMHRDHCLEQLRQYIMCHGDMTPIPTKYYKGLGRNYVLSDAPHTCRNFEKLQSWMMERYNGSTQVFPYNQTDYDYLLEE
ncbi:protein of unknown function (DUF3328) domain containing protein [Rhypophila decipiens]